MKRIIISLIVLLTTASGYAQSAVSLRDSLNAAEKELELRPDSINLRLKKARWNVELGEWDYAKNEYDLILFSTTPTICLLSISALLSTRS